MAAGGFLDALQGLPLGKRPIEPADPGAAESDGLLFRGAVGMLEVVVDELGDLAQLGLILHVDQLLGDHPSVLGEHDLIALPPSGLLFLRWTAP